MSSLLRNSIFMGLFNVFGRASGVIRYFLLVAFLPKDLFSLISYSLSFGRLGRTFADGGLDNLISRDGARETDKVPEYLFHGLFLKFALSLPFILFSFFYLTVIRDMSWFEIGVIYTSMFGSIMLSLTGVLRSAFTAIERMEYVFYTNLPSRLASIAILALTLWMGWHLAVSAAAISLENVLWFILLGAVSFRYFPLRLKLNSKTLWYMASECWSLGLYAFFNVVYLSLDVMMIEYFMGVKAVAPYTYASQLMEGLIMLASGYLIAVYPVFSRLHDDQKGEYQRLFEKSVIVLLTVTLPATALLGFWAHGWMNLIPRNDPVSGTALLILSITLNVSILNTLMIIVFTSRNRQKWLILFSGGAVGLSFITNCIFIPRYGQAGAAYATLLSQVILFAALAAAVRRLFNLRIPFARPFGIAAVCLFSGGAVWLTPGVPLLAVPIPYAILLFASARLTGILSQEELRKMIEAVWPSRASD